MGDWEWDVREDRIMPSEEAWRIFGHAGPVEQPGLKAFFVAVHA